MVNDAWILKLDFAVLKVNELNKCIVEAETSVNSTTSIAENFSTLLVAY